MTNTTELGHVGLGASILVASIVRSLTRSDPALRQGVVDGLDEAFAELRDSPALDLGHEMEMLDAARRLIAGVGGTG